MSQLSALTAALGSYQQARDNGADGPVAMRVAVARFRAFFPRTPVGAVEDLIAIALQQYRIVSREPHRPSHPQLQPASHAFEPA